MQTQEYNKEKLQIVYAGFGRSGTHSLDAALSKLGYQGCHGQEISMDILGLHSKLADAMIAHDIDEIIQQTEELGYNATLEMHGMFWRAIRERRPDLKYIFVIRDFEPWYASIVETFSTTSPMFRYPTLIIPMHRKIANLLTSATAFELNVTFDEAWSYFFNPNSEPHRLARERAYERYVRDAHEISQATPNHALLFQLGLDGYSELCQFVDIDADNCPSDEPFPHLCDRAEIIRMGHLSRGIEIALYVMALVLMVLLWKVAVRVSKWLFQKKPGVKSSKKDN